MADWCLCLHEAGHATVTAAVGWTPAGATVRGGSALAGCAPYQRPRPAGPPPDVEQPLILWPSSWREWVERSAVLTAAGGLAVPLLAPQTGRQPATVVEQAQAEAGRLAGAQTEIGRLAEAHPLDIEARDALRRAVDDPAELSDDAEHLARLAWLTCGADVLSGGRWLEWIAEQARAILLAHAGEVERLAALLQTAGEVSGEAIAACLRGEKP